MSYLFQKDFGCFWGKSGTMQLISDLMGDSRNAVLSKLLNGEEVLVPLVDRVSLQDLKNVASDQAFYSMLVQGGYLALCRKAEGVTAAWYVNIPNVELMIVWKEFILDNLYPRIPQLRTLFVNLEHPERFAEDIEYFVSDRLSYFDLATPKGEEPKKFREQLYHAFMLGILSAYEDIRCRFPLSNRESGDGRYDILAVRPNAYIIFEFKSCGKEDDLEAKAAEALTQITAKRYGEDLEKSKRLVNVGIAFCGKKCRVKVG